MPMCVPVQRDHVGIEVEVLAIYCATGRGVLHDAVRYPKVYVRLSEVCICARNIQAT